MGPIYREFRRDTKTQDAVIRNLEVIGEASKAISSTFQDKHPEIPWSGMARLIVTSELPDILERVRKLSGRDMKNGSKG